jgi:2-polyprenyl-3-methyl-5-hydroxy-6-metoxy-1,4-benzoquinol methylase
MMLGYGDEFEYFECSDCGCLQIKEFPDNLSKYYPPKYYSLKKRHSSWTIIDKVRYLFSREKLKSFCGEGNAIGLLLLETSGPPKLYHWFKSERCKPDYQILDVGCGSGKLLLSLKKKGFSNLTGIDPFVDEDIFYQNGANILKKELKDMEGQFDFIMLHHSLEHMPNQPETFENLHRILKPDRFVLLRTPIASSYAWKKYGANWVQLDAPRHLFLHTIKSINILAHQVGFEVNDIIFDSTEFQFLGSEQYMRDIPLRNNRSYKEKTNETLFSEEEIRSFKIKAAELNKNGEGDQACFYLYKN